MSKERIRELLNELHTELANAPADEDTVALARALDAEVHGLLASSAPRSDALPDRLRELEVRFSVRHPVADRILREIVDALAKMGI